MTGSNEGGRGVKFVVSCLECDTFRIEADFAVFGSEDLETGEGPDECPVCGGVTQTEIIDRPGM